MDVGSIDEVDSRPSDAIALALKFSVPIYVSEEVMNEVAFIPDKDEDEDGSDTDIFKQSELIEAQEKSKDPYIRKMDKLQVDLKNAIDSEDYEKAASIRDEIKRLELSR
jgi:bifunctional DNase/RNase